MADIGFTDILGCYQSVHHPFHHRLLMTGIDVLIDVAGADRLHHSETMGVEKWPQNADLISVLNEK